MNRLILLALLPLSSACRTSGPNGTPPAQLSEPERVASAETAPQSPLLARWQVLSDAGGRLRISAILDRKVAFVVPIEVQVRIPSGLRMLSGQSSFQVPPNTPPGETSVTFEFAYTSVPTADLNLVADVGSNAMGVHATVSYRFGRREPEPIRPERSGPNVKFGTTDLGPAIETDKK